MNNVQQYTNEREGYKALYKELYGVSWGASKKLNIAFLVMLGLVVLSFIILPVLIAAVPMVLIVCPMFSVRLTRQAKEMKKYGFTMWLGVKKN